MSYVQEKVFLDELLLRPSFAIEAGRRLPKLSKRARNPRVPWTERVRCLAHAWWTLGLLADSIPRKRASRWVRVLTRVEELLCHGLKGRLMSRD